jgi:hypothetical protein
MPAEPSVKRAAPHDSPLENRFISTFSVSVFHIRE